MAPSRGTGFKRRLRLSWETRRRPRRRRGGGNSSSRSAGEGRAARAPPGGDPVVGYAADLLPSGQHLLTRRGGRGYAGRTLRIGSVGYVRVGHRSSSAALLPRLGRAVTSDGRLSAQGVQGFGEGDNPHPAQPARFLEDGQSTPPLPHRRNPASPRHFHHPPYSEPPPGSSPEGGSIVVTVSGDRIRTCDLRVMSPTSYRTAPPRVACGRSRVAPGAASSRSRAKFRGRVSGRGRRRGRIRRGGGARCSGSGTRSGRRCR